MRALVAELVGTALLLAAVVGSGIMGERLAGGNVAVALLANTLATGAALVALILTFGAISGAHFNPVVSFADASQGGLTWTQATAYSVAQCLGAVAGVAAADYMFGEPVFALVAARSHRPAAGVQRRRGDVRPARRHLGMLPPACGRRSLRRRRVHHGRVLVHRVDIVREPRRHHRAFDDGHLRRYSPRRRSAVHCRAGRRGRMLATALFGWLVPRERARH